MLPLEQLLSPIVSNLSAISTDADTENSIILKDKIKQQKLDLLEKRITIGDVNLVRPEIAASWLRSSNNGLDPFNYNYPPVMPKGAFEKRLREKAPFIQAAIPYINQLENMLSSIESYILLSDEQGTILRIVEALGKNKFHLVSGSIWNEKTTGTCSHGMCIYLKSPIQLCGPEHFSKIFANISCSSAPVYDVDGNLEGTLTIASPYLQSSHSLALVVTMSMAIQKDFQMSDKNELLTAAMESTTDGIIFINKSGIIKAANSMANAILDSSGKELIGSHIKDTLGSQPLIQSVIETGKPVLNTDIQIKKKKQKIHLCSALPVKNEHEGCILTFSTIDHPINNIQKSSGSATQFTFDRIVGSSQQTIKSINLAKKFAQFDNNILITGESGTGKEVFAQAIHNENRPNGPFIALNCAAIPKNLIESELFGYEAGAFTGAERQGKAGKIEQANGGTLFLDEIGDMPLELQAVLLRVLEDKMVTPVGGSRYIPVDFRLVTATNKNLFELVKDDLFREDLYYRICVFNVEVPPLRERGADIIELAEHFIHIVSHANGLPKPTLSNAAKYILLQYNWPGNVRQLQNAMLYAVCMCSEGVIGPEHFPTEILNFCTTAGLDKEHLPVEMIADSTSEPLDSNVSMKDIEKMMIKKALNDTDNHIREAAKMLGLSKSTLYRKIKEYELM